MPPRKKQKEIPEQRTFLFKNPSREERNKFEEAIDQLMHSEAIKKYPGLQEITDKAFLNPQERRQAILSRLDSNRGLFFKINKRIGEKNRLSPMERVEEILIMLREYIRVGETERKLYGEVFTPIDLVEEMLDGLPKEVWSNPTLKWLDPANGCGIFPAVILKRLMAGLSTWEPDEEQRYKHIMEKMLHVCELQPKNMFIYLCAFDPKDKYALNVYTGSFLTEEFDQHAQEVWGVEKFDVIVGNPPYQLQKEGFKKTQPLWNLFVEKKLQSLEKGGFLTTVHPSGWRNLEGIFKPIQTELKKRKLLNLKINNAETGQKVFGAATRFDFYQLENSQPEEGFKTQITFEDGDRRSIEIKSSMLITNVDPKPLEPLLAKEGEQTIKIIHSYSAYESRKPHMSKTQSKTHPHPCAYYTGKDKADFLYSSKKGEHFGISKVIVTPNVAGGRAIPDAQGRFGMTQFVFGIPCKPEEAKMMAEAINSELFRNIICKLHMSKCGYEKAIFPLLRKDFWKEFV